MIQEIEDINKSTENRNRNAINKTRSPVGANVHLVFSAYRPERPRPQTGKTYIRNSPKAMHIDVVPNLEPTDDSSELRE